MCQPSMRCGFANSDSCPNNLCIIVLLQQALQLLPSTLAEIDAAGVAAVALARSGPSSSSSEEPEAAAAVARLNLALRGVFAGNIFDLGAAASAALYAEVGQKAKREGLDRRVSGQGNSQGKTVTLSCFCYAEFKQQAGDFLFYSPVVCVGSCDASLLMFVNV